MRAERQAAAADFAHAEMPTEALEEWRYSRIADLDLERYGLPKEGAGEIATPDPAVAELLAALHDAVVVRTLDGRLTSADPGDGIQVVDRSGTDGAPADSWGRDSDPYATLNRAFAPTWLHVHAGTAEARTLVIVHQISDAPVAAFPRTCIEAARLAEINVIEIIAGGKGALVCPVTRLEVGEGARLNYTLVQLLDSTAWQIASQSSSVGRDASLVSAAVALGGDYARLRSESSLVAPGAGGRLLALYFGAGSQMPDFRTVQHHAAPKTQSELLYKGVVADESHSVYSGLIRVDKGAGGTNAMQTNRNLVLNEGAHADSVPNLEIEDNDVRCSHASAVGPIADDQRFYLESRGVPSRVADRLIALGFMDELLQQLPTGELRLPLRGMLASKLSNVEAVSGG
ncbi:MAG TPA: SufD family Fe-S cluster assembly protein [Acidimicrobiales bacterium]|nr:SufD family Fe-S cluster assembly protein [Acidimicrobiales bacterium]